MLSISIILLTLQAIHLALGANGIVTEYRDVYKKIGKPDQCLIHSIWDNRNIYYKIVCVMCDNAYLAVIYYGRKELDGLTVESCDVAKSITAINPIDDGKALVFQYAAIDDGRTHTFQYLLTSGECVRVDISNEAGMRYSQCLKAHRFFRRLISRYINGWRKRQAVSIKGIVKYAVHPDVIYEDKCRHTGTWNNFDERFTMKSFECFVEFAAIIYYKKDPYSAEIKMGGAKMQSEHPAYVVDSITVIPQSSGNEFRVQYQLDYDKCQLYKYVELEDGQFQDIEVPDCKWKPTWSVTELKDYRNGWKKEPIVNV